MTPDQQAALDAMLATLPPPTAEQRAVMAQVRAEIDAGFTDGVVDPNEDGGPDDR